MTTSESIGASTSATSQRRVVRVEALGKECSEEVLRTGVRKDDLAVFCSGKNGRPYRVDDLSQTCCEVAMHRMTQGYVRTAHAFD